MHQNNPKLTFRRETCGQIFEKVSPSIKIKEQ